MDPLTVISSVAQTITSCLQTAQILNELRSKYTHAALLIGSLCSELAVTSAVLSQMQEAVASNRARISDHILNAFDTALVGCVVVISCLEQEIKGLRTIEPGVDSLTWKQKTKVVWKDVDIKEILQQLRGQAGALNMLLQMLQTTSIRQMQDRLDQLTPMINRIADGTRSLRSSRPELGAPRSLLGSTALSHRSADMESMSFGGSDTYFEFDDYVVNSYAYRKALADARRANKAQRTERTARFEEAADEQSETATIKTNEDNSVHTIREGAQDTQWAGATASKAVLDDEVFSQPRQNSSTRNDESEDPSAHSPPAIDGAESLPTLSQQAVDSESRTLAHEVLEKYLVTPGDLPGVGEKLKASGVKLQKERRTRPWRQAIIPVFRRRQPEPVDPGVEEIETDASTTPLGSNSPSMSTERQGIDKSLALRSEEARTVRRATEKRDGTIEYVVLPDPEAAQALADDLAAKRRNESSSVQQGSHHEYDLTSGSVAIQGHLLMLIDAVEPLFQWVIAKSKLDGSSTARNLQLEVKRLLDVLSVLNNHIATHGGLAQAKNLSTIVDGLDAIRKGIAREKEQDSPIPTTRWGLKKSQQQAKRIKMLREMLQSLTRDAEKRVPEKFERVFLEYRTGDFDLSSSGKFLGYSRPVLATPKLLLTGLEEIKRPDAFLAGPEEVALT